MAANYGRGLSGLLKRGWHEIPEVMGSSVMAIIGLGLAYAGYRNYVAMDGDIRPYKFEYTVIRDDDPYAKYVRKD